MIDRRGFLAGLLGAAAVPLLAKLPSPAAVSVPAAQALTFHPDAFALVSESLDLEEVYRALLIDAKEIFLDSRQRAGWPVAPSDLAAIGPSTLGTVLPDGTMVNRQVNVVVREADVCAYGAHARERLLLPAMRTLSAMSCELGMDRFAPTILPQGVEYSGAAGPVRMVVAYDVYAGALIARFDVLGGSSPSASRRLQREWNARTKRRLVNARAQPRRVLPLPG